MPRVEAPGVDEVAPRKAEPRALGIAACGRRLGPERGTRSERHHPDPAAPQVQQPPRIARHFLRGDDHCCSLADQAGSQPLPEPGRRSALEDLGKLPRREIEQRDDGRHVRQHRDGHRAARRVIDRSPGAAPLGPPGGADGRAPDEEWIERQRRRTQQARRRQQPAPPHVEPTEPLGRVGEVRLQQERERLAVEGSGVERADQTLQVGGRRRRPVRILQRTRVEHDPHAATRARRGRCGDTAGHRPLEPHRLRDLRPRSSSQRSCTTTSSASNTIRRDIFDWPTRRSWKTIGTSITRAPARQARYVISIWKT